MGAPYGSHNALKHAGKLKLHTRSIDNRTRLGKQLKHLKECLASDLGGDVSTAQQVLIDRIAYKTANVHFFELAIAEGRSTDYKTYTSLTNSLRADLQVLGLERQSKEYTSYLDEVKNH